MSKQWLAAFQIYVCHGMRLSSEQVVFQNTLYYKNFGSRVSYDQGQVKSENGTFDTYDWKHFGEREKAWISEYAIVNIWLPWTKQGAWNGKWTRSYISNASEVPPTNVFISF